VARLAASQDEMLFFEMAAIDGHETSNMRLAPVTWENLADAAIANADDSDTLQYLMRAAARLRDGKMSGSVLYDLEKQAVHFLAMTNVNGFHIDEIDHTIAGSESSGVVIFDCWTPARYRGLGYHPLAIRLAAAELLKNGQRVWIFCAATNTASTHGILKAGFTYRYSLVRHRRLRQSTVVKQDRTYAPPLQPSGELA
jgi:RimJ/RimL family protein N-acetyltransferase